MITLQRGVGVVLGLFMIVTPIWCKEFVAPDSVEGFILWCKEEGAALEVDVGELMDRLNEAQAASVRWEVLKLELDAVFTHFSRESVNALVKRFDDGLMETIKVLDGMTYEEVFGALSSE